MKKSIRSLSALAILLSSSSVFAVTTQFRSLIDLRRGPIHCPLEDIRDTFWYESHFCDCDDYTWCGWSFDAFGGLYHRSADEAFIKFCEKDRCCQGIGNICTDTRNKSTTDTVPLAALFFGQSTFTAKEVLGNVPPGTDIVGINPFLLLARITPRFEYNESGAVFGLNTCRRFGCDDKWRVGFRFTLPVKVIDVNQDNGCPTIEEICDQAIAEVPIELDSGFDPNQIDFAYRLDVLSALQIPIPSLPPVPGVSYGEGSSANPTEAAGKRASALPSELSNDPTVINPPGQVYPPVFVIKSVNGTIPECPYRKPLSELDGALPADGSGTEGQVLYFDELTDYNASLGNDQVAQSTLFLVPRRLPDSASPTSPENIYGQANDIRQRIKSALEAINKDPKIPAQEFFQKCCIDFCRSQRVSGVGDLFAEMYVGRDYNYNCHDFMGNFIVGLRLPTGKEANDPREIYYQTLGHNKHTEIELGVDGCWRPRDWFVFHLDLYYFHAFKRKVKRAAPFCGATIRNIGTCIEAETSWDYIQFNADFNFFHPCNPEMGIVFGYDLFAKSKDNVKLCQCEAINCFGTRQELDPCLLECRTQAMTHKLRSEFFNRWNFCELFFGASHIVAGKFAMKESEAYGGVRVYF